MTSHTPGPWNAKEFDEWDDTIRINSPNETLIARVKRFGVAESEANARLIAKAPEMLRLLKYYVAILRNDMAKGRWVYFDCDAHSLTETERLIAEIEGESE